MVRAIVLAPAHADSDHRVRRTIRALSGVVAWADVFWDERYPGHSHVATLDAARGSDHYVAMRRSVGMNGLADLAGVPHRAHTAALGASLAYVHASGTDGLLLARGMRAVNPGLRVIFDYHDSLPFELSYQLRKRRLGAAYRIAWPAQRLLLRRLARHVDAVVGISPGQLRQYEAITGFRGPTLAIPNFRSFDPSLARAAVGGLGATEVVWIGQVMRGRDLDRLVEWVGACAPDVTLAVHGGVLHEDAARAIGTTLGDRARLHGPFEGDSVLAARLGPRPVGAFLGWDDPDRTGINAIASPNKFYSYVNLGVPVIVDARLEGLATELRASDAGLAVSSREEFVAAVTRIRTDFPRFAKGVARLKEDYIRRSLEDEIGAFVKGVMSGILSGAPTP